MAKHEFSAVPTDSGQQSQSCKKPPCWCWILIVLLVLLIAIAVLLAVFLRNNGSYKPPNTATLMMECPLPRARSPYTSVSDLCWLDNVTLVIGELKSKRLLKATVDTQNNTCSVSVLDPSIYTLGLGCSANDKKIYALSGHNVKVYDTAGAKKEWKPEGLTGRLRTIKVNSNYIVIGFQDSGPLSVYNINREFLYNLSINGKDYKYIHTYLSEDDLLLGSTYGESVFIIHDLNDGTSVKVGGYGKGDGEFGAPGGLCVAGSHILLSDFRAERLNVYSQRGEYVHSIRPGTGSRLEYAGAMATNPSNENNILAIAVGSNNKNKVNIYTLTHEEVTSTKP